MKPVLQVYGIIADKLDGNHCDYSKIYEKLSLSLDERTAKEKLTDIKESDAKKLLFDPILRTLTNSSNNQTEITSYFKSSGLIDKNSIKPGDELDIKILNTIKRKKKENDKKIEKKNPISKFVTKV